MDFEVRRADARDAPAIAALNAEVQRVHAEALPWRFKPPGPGTLTASDAEALLGRAGHFAFVACLGGAPVGYVAAEAVHRPETAAQHAFAMVYVHQIGVREWHRGRGVDRALLDAVEAHGRSVGATRIALDAWSFNEGAIASFRGYGLMPFNVRLWGGID